MTRSFLLCASSAIALSQPVVAQLGECATTHIATGYSDQHILPYQASPDCSPSITPDGRWVVFVSSQQGLVPEDTDHAFDVFVKDRYTGSVELVSVRDDDEQTGSRCTDALISADGRYVVFTSNGDDLVADDDNLGWDVFLRDRALGTTTLVSKRKGGFGEWGFAVSVAISADGSSVLFTSTGVGFGFAESESNWMDDLFLWRRTDGGLEWVTPTQGGFAPNRGVSSGAISATGRFVVMEAFPNFTPGQGPPMGISRALYVRDRATGTMQLVSETIDGGQDDTWQTDHSSISDDGRFVAFQSASPRYVAGDTNGYGDVFVRDLQSHVTWLVSCNRDGHAANGWSRSPSISADGRYVVFRSAATDLVDGTTPSTSLYVRDLVAQSTRAIDVDDASPYDDVGRSRALSNGARSVVFRRGLGFPAFDLSAEIYVRECVRRTATPYCFGTSSTCPCGNGGAESAGCANGSSFGGAQLVGSGVPSIGTDEVAFRVSGLPPSTTILFVQGDERQESALGDGLDCLAGNTVRLGLRQARDGNAAIGFEIAGSASISSLGHVLHGGRTRHYQARYRDAAAYCTPATINGTNALSIEWIP